MSLPLVQALRVPLEEPRSPLSQAGILPEAPFWAPGTARPAGGKLGMPPAQVPWVEGRAQQSKFELSSPKASCLYFHAQTHGSPGSQDSGCPGLSRWEEGRGFGRLIGCRGGSKPGPTV